MSKDGILSKCESCFIYSLEALTRETLPYVNILLSFYNV